MGKSMIATLIAYPALQEDVYRDIARINKVDRGGIREGRICTITAKGKTIRLIVRGIAGNLSGCVLLDDRSRDRLGIRTTGISTEFRVEEAGIFGQLRWACEMADPGARIAAWIGVWSLILGGAGAVLAVLGLWIAVHGNRQ